MKILLNVVLAPFLLVWYWGIGIVKLAKNDLHPHPNVRAGVMLYLAATIIAIVIFVPMLHQNHPTAEKVFCASAVVALGLVSYLFNHRWRHAFF